MYIVHTAPCSYVLEVRTMYYFLTYNTSEEA